MCRCPAEVFPPTPFQIRFCPASGPHKLSGGGFFMTLELRRSIRRRCAALLAAALLLRGFLYLRTAAVSPAVGFWGAAIPYAVPESQTALPSRQLPPLRFRDLPEPEPPEPTFPDFAAEDAAKISVTGSCSLPYDKAALLTAPLSLPDAADGPQVLIVQTHTSEAYTQIPGREYEETELCRTLNPDHSVVRVGAEIAAVLEARGISVLHDSTVNDHPAYSGAYDRMEAVIRSYLADYPSIRMVLDVHRDAFYAPDGSLGGTAKDGRAQIMLVVGTNEGGLYHPDWQGNLSFALKLESLLQTDDPGLSRGISLCPQRYNQHLTPLSLLCEFGAAGDTLEEALAAAGDFADSLADLLTALP